MLNRLYNWLHRNECYVIADARDNSITFSKLLAKQLDIDGLQEAKVYVFEIKDPKNPEKRYGFCLNPQFKQETQLADIMYNSKYKCVGFECLVPTVNRIFYDYGLPSGCKCKLSVKKHIAIATTYYEICRCNK